MTLIRWCGSKSPSSLVTIVFTYKHFSFSHFMDNRGYCNRFLINDLNSSSCAGFLCAMLQVCHLRTNFVASFYFRSLNHPWFAQTCTTVSFPSGVNLGFYIAPHTCFLPTDRCDGYTRDFNSSALINTPCIVCTLRIGTTNPKMMKFVALLFFGLQITIGQCFTPLASYPSIATTKSSVSSNSCIFASDDDGDDSVTDLRPPRWWNWVPNKGKQGNASAPSFT